MNMNFDDENVSLLLRECIDLSNTILIASKSVEKNAGLNNYELSGSLSILVNKLQEFSITLFTSD